MLLFKLYFESIRTWRNEFSIEETASVVKCEIASGDLLATCSIYLALISSVILLIVILFSRALIILGLIPWNCFAFRIDSSTFGFFKLVTLSRTNLRWCLDSACWCWICSHTFNSLYLWLCFHQLNLDLLIQVGKGRGWFTSKSIVWHRHFSLLHQYSELLCSCLLNIQIWGLFYVTSTSKDIYLGHLRFDGC